MPVGQETPEVRTDEALLAEAAAGSGAAFEALVGRYFGMVYAVALARLGERERAEEAAQEVFLRAHLRLAGIREPRVFPAWLTRVTRNVAEDWARRGLRNSLLLPMIPLEEMSGEPADPRQSGARESLQLREELEALDAALERLPSGSREVVLMHYLEDLSKAEIARRLGVHQSTVGRQLDAALTSLRFNLGAGRSEGARISRTLRPAAGAGKRAAAAAGVLAGMSGEAKAAVLSALAGEAAQEGATGRAGGAWNAVHSIYGFLKTGGVTMAAGKQLAAVVAVATLVGGGYYYRNVATAESRALPTEQPVGIRPGQSGGLNAFTVKMNSPNGEIMQVEGKDIPPEPFTSIGLRGDAAVELGMQMYTRGGASAVPLEDQLFGGKRSGEIFIQPIKIDGESGSILFFKFPSVAEAQAGLQIARESTEGQGTEIRQRENFVAVVIGGSNAPGKQQAFRKAAAQALDQQWGQ